MIREFEWCCNDLKEDELDYFVNTMEFAFLKKFDDVRFSVLTNRTIAPIILSRVC